MKCLRSLIVLVFLFIFIFVSDIYAKAIYILNVNDFHSMIYHNKTSYVPGMVFFMNAILSEVKKHGRENVILVSGGDNYQGSIVSFITQGSPVSDMFRELKVAFSAVGNHEFDWGQQLFRKWQKDGNFVYLAANIVNEETGKAPAWIEPYKMVKKNGVKLAFIGLSTLETATRTNARNFKGLKIVEPWISAQFWIDYLKAGKDKEGVPDVIVALTHIPSVQDKITGEITGEEINNLCSKTQGLDIIISGHSHKTVCGRNVAGGFIIQAEEAGKKYGIVKIEIDDKTNKANRIEGKVCSVSTDVKILPENSGEKILSKYADINNKYSKVIGKSATTLPYDGTVMNALGGYIAKLMAESTNSKIAFINGIGIRGGLNKGDITVADIFRISPFNNSLVNMKLSGKNIKAVIEYGLNNYRKNRVGCVQFYGMKVIFDHSKPAGGKIISMTLNDGREIEKDKYYSVCAPDFMFSGGDGYKFDDATDVKVYNGLFVRDIIIRDIKTRKSLTLPDMDCLTDIAESKFKDAA